MLEVQVASAGDPHCQAEEADDDDKGDEWERWRMEFADFFGVGGRSVVVALVEVGGREGEMFGDRGLFEG